MQKETLKGIIIAVVVTLLAVVFINSVVSKNEEMVKVPINDFTSGVDRNSFEDGFIEGCVEEGATYSECDCMWNSVITQLGFDGVVEMTLDYLRTEELPLAVMTNAYNDCY